MKDGVEIDETTWKELSDLANEINVTHIPRAL
jgi:LDH2 family malate/lactate/ureidoglycolate dehydrogenase